MLIDKDLLKHLSTFAAGEPTRYALHAVRVERRADGQARLVATDGKRLAVYEPSEVPHDQYPVAPGTRAADAEPVPGFVTLLPLTAAKQAAELVRSRRGAEDVARLVLLEEPTANGTVTLRATNYDESAAIHVQPLQGQYPEYEAVIPEPTPATHVQVTLDAQFLKDAAALAERLGNGYVRVSIARRRTQHAPVLLQAETTEVGGGHLKAVVMPVYDVRLATQPEPAEPAPEVAQ